MLKEFYKKLYINNANIILLIYVLVHYFFIFYLGSGQTGDDDFHYYAISERFSYANNLNLNALINSIDQESVEIYDVGRLNISFSNGYQYPLWTLLFFYTKQIFSLDFVQVNFIFYLVQMILFSYGLNNFINLIGNNNKFRLKNLILLLFIGMVSVPTILVSIPMNMCVALNFYAYSLLIQKKRIAFLYPFISIFIHPASLIIIIFTLMILTIYSFLNRKVLFIEIISYVIIFVTWPLFYMLLLSNIGVNLDNKIAFDLNKIKFFLKSYDYFFMVYSLLFLIMIFNYKLLKEEFKLLLSILLSSILIILCYLLTDNQFSHHPLLNPFGRIFYFLPYVLHLTICISVLKYFELNKKISFVIVAILLFFNVINSYKITTEQLLLRDYGNIGQLRIELVGLFNPNESNSFIFDNHAIGLVLASSGFLNNKFYWTKVSKPKITNDIDNYFFFFKPGNIVENLCYKNQIILKDKSIIYHYIKCN